jgi:hypothetical protein
MDLYVVDNDNMTSVTVTGAKLGNVQVSDHADLAALTLDHTTSLREASTTASADEKSVTIQVTTNPSLASLTAGMDDVSGLLVYTNAALATVDFTGLADDGSATTSYAHIFNNNLTFDLVKDGYDTGTSYTLTDTGSTTGGGGIATLKTWIQHVDGAVNTTNGLYVFVDAVTKYEVQSTLNGAYTDTAVPTAPSVTTQATAFTNRTSIYAVAALEAAETATTYTNGADAISETQTVVIPVTNNVLYAAKTDLASNEGFAINLNGLSKTFRQGQTYNGSTVTTVADLVAYVNGDTSWGSDITVTATNTGFMRSNQTVNFTRAVTGNPGQVSVTGSNSKLWFKLGSTSISGTITLTNSEVAADIAQGLATTISSMKNTAQAYTYGAAYIAGGTIAITKRVSVAGYPDDITSGVSSLPAISFVIDAAQTSTTLGLGTGNTGAAPTTTSNLASLNQAGWSSGIFLNVTKNDVPGVTVKLVNSNNGVAELATDVISAANVYATNTSGTMGATGRTTSITTENRVLQRIITDAGYTTQMLVSGTHFLGPNSTHAAVFADVSTATTSTTQAAAVTNRSGWL